MTQLPTNRTDQSTVAEHVSDHNILHAEHNDLDGHVTATTTVHGITDTSALVTTSDSRLTDTRIPTDGSVTDAKVASNAAIAKSKLAALAIVDADVSAISESKITNLVTDLAGKAASTHTHAESDVTNLTTDLAAKANIDGAGTGAVAAAHTGDTVTASSTQAIAIGKNASANTGAEAIAIGGGVSATAAPQATGQGGIAIGASNGTSVAGARASGANSVAIGSGDTGLAGASASASSAIAFGYASSASANVTIAIGSGAASTAISGVAIGVVATASAVETVALGRNAQATTNTQAIAIGGGANTTAGPLASGQGGIAIGGSNSSGVNGARASGANSVAIGSGDATTAGASATHAGAIVLGKGVASTNTNQLNIGTARSFVGAPSTAPADADLVNSQVSLYLDETNSRLAYKGKTSGGSVLNQSLALNGSYVDLTTVDAKGDLLAGTADNTVGRLAVGSDGQVLTADSTQTAGVKWAAAGSGAMTKIADSVLGSNTASVTFSSISGSYRHLMIVGDARSDRSAAATDALCLRFNSDTGNNYDDMSMQDAGTTVTGVSPTLATNRIRACQLTAASATANVSAGFVIDIPNYAGTTFRKTVLARSILPDGAGSSSMQLVMGGGAWRSTSAITSITLLPSVGTNFLAGSTFSLYGVS